MLRPLAVIVLAAALLAGCGSSKKSSTGSSSSSSSGGTTISMKDIQFSPKSLTVKVGQTVTWVNDDSVDHNVTANDGKTFKSSNFGHGGTFKWKATKAGTVAYNCTIHSGMTGTLTVTQ
jgi:plastocyanin